ncbi:MAG: hypothetical protein R2713_05410 [Ilumatobacteraceae bacterium]
MSRTTAEVPVSASAHRRVSVATPLMWHSRLRAVRSAVSSSRVGASTRATTVPACTRAPSATRNSTSLDAAPHTVSITAAATARPDTTPVERAPNSPTLR